MKIILSNRELDSISMEQEQKVVSAYNAPYYSQPSGVEHYRLLSYLSFCLDNKIVCDIGTNRGASALALSVNKTNRIYTVDIENIMDLKHVPENVSYIIGNYQQDVQLQSLILSSNFIMLDVDHLYNNEIWLYNYLLKSGWRGLMLCDDIHLNSEMKRFWNEVNINKLDITKYGHLTGTGAVFFGNDVEIVLK